MFFISLANAKQTNMENTSVHLLSDIVAPHLVQASTAKRFFNYIIDLICFYAMAFLLGIVIAFISPSFFEGADDGGIDLLDRLIALVLYAIIMGFTEGLTKGRSLGKLITGTKAVKDDGSPINFKIAFLRGLCRAVPLDAFSALGAPSYPWHDKWTHTYVIDIKESILPEQTSQV